MTTDDALYRFRLRVFALAQEMGSVRAACRAMGIHHSSYYRWRRQALRYGLEVLRTRERRRPRMASQTPPHIEQRVLAFALGHPGFGPARIAAELRRPKWGGIRISSNGVWRVLRRHGLSTRAKRLALVAGYAAPPEPERPGPEPEQERHIEADRPGELVQMDCFYVGRLSDTPGVVWQYTAIDVASSYLWAELHTTPKNPSPKWTSQLARRVAKDLAARGWRLERVTTDGEASSGQRSSRRLWPSWKWSGSASPLGAPSPTGAWSGSTARSSKSAGSQRSLERSSLGSQARGWTWSATFRYYSSDRAHTGRRNKGRTPEQVIGKEKMWPR